MEATLQILQGDVQALSVRYANHCDELNGPVTDENVYRNHLLGIRLGPTHASQRQMTRFMRPYGSW